MQRRASLVVGLVDVGVRGALAQPLKVTRCGGVAKRGSVASRESRAVRCPSLLQQGDGSHPVVLDGLIERCALPAIERRGLGTKLVQEARHRSQAAFRGRNVQGCPLIIVSPVHVVALGERAQLVDVVGRCSLCECQALTLTVQQLQLGLARQPSNPLLLPSGSFEIELGAQDLDLLLALGDAARILCGKKWAARRLHDDPARRRLRHLRNRHPDRGEWRCRDGGPHEIHARCPPGHRRALSLDLLWRHERQHLIERHLGPLRRNDGGVGTAAAGTVGWPDAGFLGGHARTGPHHGRLGHVCELGLYEICSRPSTSRRPAKLFAERGVYHMLITSELPAARAREAQAIWTRS